MNDDDFVALINESVPLWLEEFKEVIDKMLLWDLIKHRIRQITIKYSKEKHVKGEERSLILTLL